MTIRRILYRQYKNHYSDCETIPGTYDKSSRSIEVVVPEGREKPSGVRGKQFSGYQLWAQDPTGKFFYTTYRAVSEENARRRHAKECKDAGWTPCDPPAGKIARIYR